jgi:hypothetical protein
MKSFSVLIIIQSLVTSSVESTNRPSIYVSKTKTTNKCADDTPKVQRSKLPEEWYGVYKGELTVNTLKENSQKVSVVLEINKSETDYTWKMTYGEGEKKMIKDYKLKPTDKANQFDLDEQNSITIPNYLLKNELICTFEVGGNLLTASYKLNDKTIQMTITTYGKPSETGHGVKNYPLIGVQTAEMKKP